MQLKPVKNDKPPAYLAKVAALLAVPGMLTGCADFPVKPVNPQGTEDLQLEGESVVEETLPATTCAETEVQLDGDIAVWEDSMP